MRRTLRLGACLAIALATACHEQPVEPTDSAGISEVSTADGMMMSVAPAAGPSAVGIDRPDVLRLGDGRFADAGMLMAGSNVINPGDYACTPGSPVIDIANSAINQFIVEEFDLFFFLFVQVWADLIPQFEALIFLEEDRMVDYGYDGDFTNQMNRTTKDLRRFWDIDGDVIEVVPMKGSMLQHAERVARTYQSPIVPPFFGLSESDAFFVAGLIQDALDASNLLDGGDHPLFSFNAFAFSGSAGLGIPPKIVMGDAILEAYDQLGFGAVAPQAILAHEWAHHIQFQNGYFSDPIPTLDPPVTAPEATRYTELMADAMAAYYLTHKRGGTMNRWRVEQFLEVFFQIGDCFFANPGHHGTPNQRMAAARFGFDVADEAQKNGQIMTADEFHDVFVAAYLGLIAPDA